MRIIQPRLDGMGKNVDILATRQFHLSTERCHARGVSCPKAIFDCLPLERWHCHEQQFAPKDESIATEFTEITERLFSLSDAA
jgi:hypothetical protein